MCSLYVNNIFTKGENLKIEMCCFEFYKWPSVNIATTDNKKKQLKKLTLAINSKTRGYCSSRLPAVLGCNVDGIEIAFQEVE